MTSEIARQIHTPAASGSPADGPSASGSGLSRPRFELRPHNCFACGSLNLHGLHLEIHVETGRSWTTTTLDRAFEGWEGIAHGGIICTILDEVMAWALVGADNWGVTAKMEVSFRRPVPVGRMLHAEGSITRSRRRLVETTARLIDAETGDVLASASGLYVAADDERKRELRERYGFRFTADGDGPPRGSAAEAGQGDTSDRVADGPGPIG